MREKYETLSVTVLRDIAKNRKIKYASTMKKSELIDAMCELDALEAKAHEPQEAAAYESQGVAMHEPQEAKAREPRNAAESQDVQPRNAEAREYQANRRSGQGYGAAERSEQLMRRNYTNDRVQGERYERPQQERAQGDRYERPQQERVQGDRYERPQQERVQGDRPQMGEIVTGILEIMQDGYGFLRSANYLSGENDVYVAQSQIRKFGLKTGDMVTGHTRAKAQTERYSALLYLTAINGLAPEQAVRRMNFEDMTPIFPNRRLRMERGSKDISMRIVDLISPIGRGQRGMIVSPPKAGKTTLLKDVARSILKNEPDMHILILLIDERPEEVTDIREAIVGDNVEVLYSTFDETPEHHRKVSEMGIERAKRLVEHGMHVTILLDSITRLARAYNLTVAPSGRTLSGGLDPAALHMPKRFFGAARNMREGGSLTILATALVDTGSKMDDVVYEEFKGTGNMEMVLDRKLSERRVFPAIDIQKSGTRREDLLLNEREQEAVYIMRKALNGMKSDEAVENILNMFVHTINNEDLVERIRRQKHI
ncbi:MAG: transcription termination factor Rho [Lachnospiraceae bacterium]|nr:transcription termination factor Rho [Lachnospiraceae bacterium]